MRVRVERAAVLVVLAVGVLWEVDHPRDGVGAHGKGRAPGGGAVYWLDGARRWRKGRAGVVRVRLVVHVRM